MGESVSPATKGIAGIGGGASVLGVLIWAFTELFGEAKQVRTEIVSQLVELTMEMRDMKHEARRSNDLQARENAAASKERERIASEARANTERLDRLERRARRRQ